MRSKMVVDRERSARSVDEAAQTHKARVAKALVEKLKPYLEDGEKMPDLEMVIALCGRLVDGEAQKLVDADAADAREHTQDAAARDARDKAVNALYQTVISVRSGVQNAYGPAGVQALSITGATPTTPDALTGMANDMPMIMP